eukprot:TRINITY_DN11116_c0_g1_i1.p1 TRINITY_DN11116_c0_g1~~TRINITY_DN11116_c0_g1_i1.p1  ORF type:complete len:1977 (+),score=410.38 TRINITY_DN11116_c0_g1_i1:397-5931(+)
MALSKFDRRAQVAPPRRLADRRGTRASMSHTGLLHLRAGPLLESVRRLAEEAREAGGGGLHPTEGDAASAEPARIRAPEPAEARGGAADGREADWHLAWNQDDVETDAGGLSALLGGVGEEGGMVDWIQDLPGEWKQSGAPGAFEGEDSCCLDGFHKHRAPGGRLERHEPASHSCCGVWAILGVAARVVSQVEGLSGSADAFSWPSSLLGDEQQAPDWIAAAALYCFECRDRKGRPRALQLSSACNALLREQAGPTLPLLRPMLRKLTDLCALLQASGGLCATRRCTFFGLNTQWTCEAELNMACFGTVTSRASVLPSDAPSTEVIVIGSAVDFSFASPVRAEAVVPPGTVLTVVWRLQPELLARLAAPFVAPRDVVVFKEATDVDAPEAVACRRLDAMVHSNVALERLRFIEPQIEVLAPTDPTRGCICFADVVPGLTVRMTPNGCLSGREFYIGTVVQPRTERRRVDSHQSADDLSPTAADGPTGPSHVVRWWGPESGGPPTMHSGSPFLHSAADRTHGAEPPGPRERPEPQRWWDACDGACARVVPAELTVKLPRPYRDMSGRYVLQAAVVRGMPWWQIADDECALSANADGHWVLSRTQAEMEAGSGPVGSIDGGAGDMPHHVSWELWGENARRWLPSADVHISAALPKQLRSRERPLYAAFGMFMSGQTASSPRAVRSTSFQPSSSPTSPPKPTLLSPHLLRGPRTSARSPLSCRSGSQRPRFPTETPPPPPPLLIMTEKDCGKTSLTTALMARLLSAPASPAPLFVPWSVGGADALLPGHMSTAVSHQLNCGTVTVDRAVSSAVTEEAKKRPLVLFLDGLDEVQVCPTVLQRHRDAMREAVVAVQRLRDAEASADRLRRKIVDTVTPELLDMIRSCVDRWKLSTYRDGREGEYPRRRAAEWMDRVARKAERLWTHDAAEYRPPELDVVAERFETLIRQSGARREEMLREAVAELVGAEEGGHQELRALAERWEMVAPQSLPAGPVRDVAKLKRDASHGIATAARSLRDAEAGPIPLAFGVAAALCSSSPVELHSLVDYLPRDHSVVVRVQKQQDFGSSFGVATSGVKVDSLDTHGAASKAGVERQFVVTELNGQPVNTPDELRAVFAAAQPGPVKATFRSSAPGEEPLSPRAPGDAARRRRGRDEERRRKATDLLSALQCDAVELVRLGEPLPTGSGDLVRLAREADRMKRQPHSLLELTGLAPRRGTEPQWPLARIVVTVRRRWLRDNHMAPSDVVGTSGEVWRVVPLTDAVIERHVSKEEHRRCLPSNTLTRRVCSLRSVRLALDPFAVAAATHPLAPVHQQKVRQELRLAEPQGPWEVFEAALRDSLHVRATRLREQLGEDSTETLATHTLCRHASRVAACMLLRRMDVAARSELSSESGLFVGAAAPLATTWKAEKLGLEEAAARRRSLRHEAEARKELVASVRIARRAPRRKSLKDAAMQARPALVPTIMKGKASFRVVEGRRNLLRALATALPVRWEQVYGSAEDHGRWPSTSMFDFLVARIVADGGPDAAVVLRDGRLSEHAGVLRFLADRMRRSGLPALLQRESAAADAEEAQQLERPWEAQWLPREEQEARRQRDEDRRRAEQWAYAHREVAARVLLVADDGPEALHAAFASPLADGGRPPAGDAEAVRGAGAGSTAARCTACTQDSAAMAAAVRARRRVMQKLSTSNVAVRADDRFCARPPYLQPLLAELYVTAVSALPTASLPLHCARGGLLCSVLLSCGGSPHEVDRYHRTPLHCSAAANDSEAAEELLAAGSRLDARDHVGYTPLHAAAAHGAHEAAATLLMAGADPRLLSRAGQTPSALADALGSALPLHVDDDADGGAPPGAA